MFIGHFGIGLAVKPLAPRVSLGWLFFAAQFIDLLWPAFLLIGIERVQIVPGATVVTPLVFEHYPFSHSLAAVFCWAVLVGCGYLLIRRERTGAIVLAALVISHWLLDAIVHQPDLPVFPGGAQMIGLDAWASLPLTLAIEVTLFGLGAWLYFHATSPVDATGHWGFIALAVFLPVVYAINLFGTPPPSVKAIAWAGQMQWLLVLWGFWIDKHRDVRNSSQVR
jgi:membrane-bound metal-dependent hydrolase YbcI (DUF457 family)